MIDLSAFFRRVDFSNESFSPIRELVLLFVVVLIKYWTEIRLYGLTWTVKIHIVDLNLVDIDQ